MAVPTQDELVRLSNDELLEILRAYREEYDRRTDGDLLGMIRKQLAESGELEAGEVPVKVIFHASEFENGWFYGESDARVFLKGESEPFRFDFEGDDFEGLLANLSDHAGGTYHLVVDLVHDSVDDDEGCCC